MGTDDDPTHPGPDGDPAAEDAPGTVAGSPAPEPADGSPAASRRRPPARLVALVGAVVLAVLGAGLIGWAVTHQTGPPPEPPLSVPAVSGRALPDPALSGPPPPTTSAPAPAAPTAPPTTLTIAAIGVTSPVDQVGLNPDRTMEVPAQGSPGYDHAAWYRFSVAPGLQGPSVIIGHVDSRAEGPSVFYALGRLRPGDRAEVGRADGVTVTFEVVDVRRFPKEAFPTDLVYGPTPGPELRLITCGGTFDAGARSYEDNTVVFAREVARP